MSGCEAVAVSIQFNIKNMPRLGELVDRLPLLFSYALNDSLYTTRDKLIRSTWVGDPGGRKLKAQRQRDIGRRVLRVKRSDEYNLSGSIEVDADAPAKGSRAAQRSGLTIQDWIHGFVHSQAPIFWGKSKKERIRMALGAYYRLKRTREYREVAAKVKPEVFIDDFIRLMTEEAVRRFPARVMRELKLGAR